jgi:transposase
MSLNPCPMDPVPPETARVARAAFPNGNRSMTMRDELGVIYPNDLFVDLYPPLGHYGEPPWRLALVTLMQFSEHLTDRQAADAVRGRIDWKYALGLELTATGFDFSVLSEFRTRLVAGAAEERLLTTMLDGFTARGLLRRRGHQRTDSTHIVAAVRSGGHTPRPWRRHTRWIFPACRRRKDDGHIVECGASVAPGPVPAFAPVRPSGPVAPPAVATCRRRPVASGRTVAAPA